MHYIVTYLPWLMSVITIYQVAMTGNLHKRAWVVGLFNQALWLFWILVSKNYGLLPMNLALWYVFARNHFKWNQKTT